MSIGYNTVYYVLVFAVNLEPPWRRQEISGAWEINPYLPFTRKGEILPRSGARQKPASRPLPVAPSSKRQRRRLSGEPRASAQIESAIGRAFYRCGLL